MAMSAQQPFHRFRPSSNRSSYLRSYNNSQYYEKSHDLIRRSIWSEGAYIARMP